MAVRVDDPRNADGEGYQLLRRRCGFEQQFSHELNGDRNGTRPLGEVALPPTVRNADGSAQVPGNARDSVRSDIDSDRDAML